MIIECPKVSGLAFSDNASFVNCLFHIGDYSLNFPHNILTFSKIDYILMQQL